MHSDEQDTSRWVGYMRVSTDEQDFALQRDALIKHGVHPDRIFSDVMSGAKMDRDGLRLAIKAMWTGDTLVVWKLDRLGRNTIGALQQIEALNNAGVKLISITENIDASTPMGKLMITILAGVAQWERDLIAERTKAGIKAFKDRGGKMGPKHPVLDRPWRLEKFHELVAIGAVRVGREDKGGLPDPRIVEILNATDEKHAQKSEKIKPMSPGSYRNWKGKGFEGYQMPNEDDVIEVGDDE